MPKLTKKLSLTDGRTDPNYRKASGCYVGRFYAAHLPPTSAATPSAADVEPRANAYNLPSFNMGIVINKIHIQRFFNINDNEAHPSAELYF